MKKLLNTLYVTTPDAYLSLDGENVVVRLKDNEIGRVPIHNLENIVTFGWQGASPALMRHICESGKGYALNSRFPSFPTAKQETFMLSAAATHSAQSPRPSV